MYSTCIYHCHDLSRDFIIELLTYEVAFDLEAESVPQEQELDATR
jgi:hypothetical protein